MIRNLPCDTGRKIGKRLAAWADDAMPEYAASWAEHGMPVPQRCRTCAFRLGTSANGSLATVADALKCVMELSDFVCHQKDAATPEGQHVCVGWAMLVSEALKEGKPAVEMPWDFVGGFDEKEL